MRQRTALVLLLTASLYGCGSETLNKVSEGLTQGGNNSVASNAPAPSSNGASVGGLASALSSGDIASGLKEALAVGTDKVVAQLSAAGGFANDPKIHIPLPKSLEKAKSVASKFGVSAPFDDLENKLNQAAEAATPQAKSLFLDAINGMSIDDARGILNGPNDAATRYLQEKMSSPLGDAMKPIVDNALSEVGAVQAYEGLSSQLGSAANLVPNLKADLSKHVLEKGMGGIFDYLAVEEAAIRENPVQRTTDLLKKVFTK